MSTMRATCIGLNLLVRSCSSPWPGTLASLSVAVGGYGDDLIWFELMFS